MQAVCHDPRVRSQKWWTMGQRSEIQVQTAACSIWKDCCKKDLHIAPTTSRLHQWPPACTNDLHAASTYSTLHQCPPCRTYDLQVAPMTLMLHQQSPRCTVLQARCSKESHFQTWTIAAKAEMTWWQATIFNQNHCMEKLIRKYTPPPNPISNSISRGKKK